LVVLSVILWATKTDILSWIRNLPGYQQSNDSIREVNKDTLKNLGYEQVGIIEDYGGVIKIGKEGNYQLIPFYAEFNSGGTGNIYAPRNLWGMDYLRTDAKIGTVIGDHLVVDFAAYNTYKQGTDFDDEMVLLDYSKAINSGGEFGLWRLKSTPIHVFEKSPEEIAWENILEEYSRIKCVVDDYICGIKTEGCACFTAGDFQMKRKFEICSGAEKYCYDGTSGCSSDGPNNVVFGLSQCQKTNPNFKIAPDCVRYPTSNLVSNPPCSCASGGDLDRIKNFGEKPLMEVCLQGQYCDYGHEGCKDKP